MRNKSEYMRIIGWSLGACTISEIIFHEKINSYLSDDEVKDLFYKKMATFDKGNCILFSLIDYSNKDIVPILTDLGFEFSTPWIPTYESKNKFIRLMSFIVNKEITMKRRYNKKILSILNERNFKKNSSKSRITRSFGKKLTSADYREVRKCMHVSEYKNDFLFISGFKENLQNFAPSPKEYIYSNLGFHGFFSTKEKNFNGKSHIDHERNKISKITNLSNKYKRPVLCSLNRIQTTYYNILIESGFIPITPFCQSERYPNRGVMIMMYIPEKERINNFKVNQNEPNIHHSKDFLGSYIPCTSQKIKNKRELQKIYYFDEKNACLVRKK